MLKWKSKKETNGTCYLLDLSNNIEVSLFKRYGNNDHY